MIHILHLTLLMQRRCAMSKINVVTHDGIFHADEIFAVMLLGYYLEGELSILRTRDKNIIDEYIDDENVYLVDVGGIHDSSKLCFDHHQNRDIPSSNLLVFNYLYNKNYIDDDIHMELFPFIQGISDFDINFNNVINYWKEFNSDHKYRILSTIISGFNRDPNNHEQQHNQFMNAVSFARQVYMNEIYAANQRIDAERIYGEGVRLNDDTIRFYEFCSIWKDKGKYKYAIQPNPQGWAVISSDSSKYPLPDASAYDSFIFQHKGRFIAVFGKYIDAEMYADSLSLF